MEIAHGIFFESLFPEVIYHVSTRPILFCGAMLKWIALSQVGIESKGDFQ